MAKKKPLIFKLVKLPRFRIERWAIQINGKTVSKSETSKADKPWLDTLYTRNACNG